MNDVIITASVIIISFLQVAYPLKNPSTACLTYTKHRLYCTDMRTDIHMTVLLEYFNPFGLLVKHSKHLGGLGPCT